MNDTVKILNDALVQTACTLEELHDKSITTEAEEEMVQQTLRDASEALAQVPEYDRGGVTWQYSGPPDIDSPDCSGDACHL